MKYRKLLCVAMVLALLLGLSGSGLALTLDTISTGPMGTVTGIVEEKIYSKATLEDDFADDRVLVVLNNAASLKLKTYTAADFPEISCASVSDLSTATKARVSAKLKGEDVAAACGAKSDSIVFSDFYEVDVQKYNQILCLTLPAAGKQNVLAAMKLLMQRDDVKYAGPDYAIYANWTTPNDALYYEQWAANTILLPLAWGINTGSYSVTVGIIDSGIQASHPDLSNRINPYLSRDFTSGQAVKPATVTDSLGHGTMVAGVIGAQGNNNIGISGVAWDIRMVSLKVLESSRGYSSYAYQAIDYASECGIPILNCSLGWHPGTYPDDGIVWYNQALDEVIENYPGLFVCAAGNDGLNNDQFNLEYPTNFVLDNLISVGASTQMDTRCTFSNIGELTVDIFAPGEGIWTTTRTGSYTTQSGTSFAAPFVTGVAALLLSECRSISATALKDKIIDNCDVLYTLEHCCSSSGRLNAYKVLQNAHTYTRYSHNNSATHFHICNCGEKITEPHTFINLGVQFACKFCAYTTTEP